MDKKQFFIAKLSGNFTIKNEVEFNRLLKFLVKEKYIHKRYIPIPFTDKVQPQYFILEPFYVNNYYFYQGMRWTGVLDYKFYLGYPIGNSIN